MKPGRGCPPTEKASRVKATLRICSQGSEGGASVNSRGVRCRRVSSITASAGTCISTRHVASRSSLPPFAGEIVFSRGRHFRAGVGFSLVGAGNMMIWTDGLAAGPGAVGADVAVGSGGKVGDAEGVTVIVEGGSVGLGGGGILVAVFGTSVGVGTVCRRGSWPGAAHTLSPTPRREVSIKPASTKAQ